MILRTFAYTIYNCCYIRTSTLQSLFNLFCYCMVFTNAEFILQHKMFCADTLAVNLNQVIWAGALSVDYLLWIPTNTSSILILCTVNGTHTSVIIKYFRFLITNTLIITIQAWSGWAEAITVKSQLSFEFTNTFSINI